MPSKQRTRSQGGLFPFSKYPGYTGKQHWNVVLEGFFFRMGVLTLHVRNGLNQFINL